jgi:arabinose-5-phosphate isomerase
VTGIGKARDIGNKIQSTLASTGSPSYRIHPVEALHGDLGMIEPDDVILLLSKSGETQELIHLCPLLSKIGCKLILITANPKSTCAQLCEVILEIGDAPEACPLGLAPSSSTAAMLALGDALALTVMERKNVRPEQYASFHPGGALGRSLMVVSEIMRIAGDCPTVAVTGTLRDYRSAVKDAPRRAGAAAVIDSDKKLVGFFTHGDYFRLMDESAVLPDTPIQQVMTRNPKFAAENDLVGSALVLMRRHLIDELPVVDDDHKLIGMIDIQDLVAEGFSAFDIG